MSSKQRVPKRYRMKHATAREWIHDKGSPVATLMLASVLIGGSIGFAARAEADPVDAGVVRYALINEHRMCVTLAAHPTVGGVEGLVLAIQSEGLTPFQSGQALAIGVGDACPELLPVLQAFVNAYSPAQTFATGGAR